MADIVDPATRSRMMAGIRGTNTQPELSIRRALHRLGFRYSLRTAKTPGKPDIAFPSRRAAVFVNGCFWHGHDCRLFRLPATREEFWRAKIERNRARDAIVTKLLADAGWRQLIVWECAIRGKNRSIEPVIELAADWLRNGQENTEIRGES